MKNQLKLLSIVLAAFVMTSCSQFIYSEHTNPYTLPDPQAGKIKLDEKDYDLYVRAVSSSEFRVPGEKNGHRMLNLKGSASKSVPQLLPAAESAAPEKLIEIEYLFISKDLQNVLYISTVADRYQNRYSGSGFLGLDTPNAANFRVFLFGKCDPLHKDKFIFYGTDGQHADIWTMPVNSNGARVLHLIEQKRFNALEEAFLLDDALYHKLVFEKLKHWQLMYLPKSDTNPKNAESYVGDEIIIGKPDNNSYSLLFTFANHAISFPKKYVIYSPEKLLEAAK